MSQPEPVNILSDDDEDEEVEGKYYKSKDNAAPLSQYDAVCIDLSTPSPNLSKKKKQRFSDPSVSNPSLSISSAPVFIIDDDVSVVAASETPPLIPSRFSKTEDVSIVKPSYGSSGAESTPSFVAETPISELLAKSELPIVRCNRGDSNSQPLAPSSSPSQSRLICHHSDKETERDLEAQVPDETTGFIVDLAEKIEFSSRFVGSTSSFGGKSELLSKSKIPIVRCNHRGDSSSQPSAASLFSNHSSPYNESERGLERQGSEETTGSNVDLVDGLDLSSRSFESTSSFGEINETRTSPHPDSVEDDLTQVHGIFDGESDRMECVDEVFQPKCKNKNKAISEKGLDNSIGKGRVSKEERLRLKEEQKQKREQEKLQKAAQKAELAELKKLQKEKRKFNLQQEKLEKAAQKTEAAELKKLQKEKQKWEKGKFAQKSIVAQIDSKIVEMGSIAGHLLTRFGENGLSYRVTSNPIERSIVWTMTVPEELSKISCARVVIPYVLLIYEAEEFCNLVMSGTLMDQVSWVQNHYPKHTICYLMNRLMAYINKREQGQYRNPGKYEGWKRPPIEEVLAKLTTHFTRVHSRLCFDEAELAEHVVGLTRSLASCQYRKKQTPLSVNANGSVVPKDCPDRNLIKKNTWLKALVAIPKVQPRFAIAIWKKYPTMKSLLSVYMDPSKSVHEKEFLLKNLTTEGLIGDDRRLGEICSKRVYRILMAQCGNIITDDVEHGADFFHHQTF